jgi:probable biosynthetic protein (TIGR04099 family)
MPQLSGVGLSETWLLETCGDLHWSMICHGLGVPSHELRDALGRRIYISFIAVQVSSTYLNAFREGDLVQHSSSLVQRSATRFESVHRWVCGSKAVDVEMLSTFLCRRGDGGNALEEAQLAGLPESTLGSTPSHLERAIRSQ